MALDGMSCDGIKKEETSVLEDIKNGQQALNDTISAFRGLGDALTLKPTVVEEVNRLVVQLENNGHYTLATLALDACKCNLDVNLIVNLADKLPIIILNVIIESFKFVNKNILSKENVIDYFNTQPFSIKKAEVIFAELFEREGLNTLVTMSTSAEELGRKINLGIIAGCEYPVFNACYPFVLNLLIMNSANLTLQRDANEYTLAFELCKIYYKYRTLAKDKCSVNVAHNDFLHFLRGLCSNNVEKLEISFGKFVELTLDKQLDIIKKLIVFVNAHNSLLYKEDINEFKKLFTNLVNS